MPLVDDIINCSLIVDLLNQYASTIKHECVIQQRPNLYNKTRSIQDKANWYLTQLKSDLGPDDARHFDNVIKDTQSLGAFTIIEYALMLDEEQRNHLKELIFALKNNQKVEIKILD